MTPALEITFLGTGTSSGVPMVACGCEVCTSTDEKDKRFRSSIMVKSETTAIVVDTTPDFRSQMLRENVKRLDAVLYTHHHKDHIAGMDDVKAFNYFQQQEMQVYANELTAERLKNEFSYVFTHEKYPGVPDVNLNIIDMQPLIVGDIPIIPIMVWHMRLPVLGFRFGNFTYITDANRIEAAEQEKIRGSNTVVLNALRKEKHVSHFTLDEAIAMVGELAIPNAYFTHISHQLGRHADISAALPPGIHLAYDGLKLNFPAF